MSCAPDACRVAVVAAVLFNFLDGGEGILLVCSERHSHLTADFCPEGFFETLKVIFVRAAAGYHWFIIPQLHVSYPKRLRVPVPI